MSVEVNSVENLEGAERIDTRLGFTPEESQAFIDKYADFIEAQLIESSQEEGLNSAVVYDRIKETFQGKELELFIAQITSQAIVGILNEYSRPPSLGDLLASAFSGEPCGPDCDCQDDGDLSTDHAAVKGDA